LYDVIKRIHPPIFAHFSREAIVAKPEDEKIDFEKFSLSEDLSGSLEPLTNGADSLLPTVEHGGAELNPEDSFDPTNEPTVQVASESADESEPVSAASDRRGFFQKLAGANPYNVLLAVAVAALLIAILCCLIELGRYGFDLGAKGAKHSAMLNNAAVTSSEQPA
jgi:hypothetical protein